MSHIKLPYEYLESLYRAYNHKKFIRYDPIKYVHKFNGLDEKEIELAGLIASSLSFGRVTQIFKALDYLFYIMEDAPLDYLIKLNRPSRDLLAFKYRFITGKDLYNFFIRIKEIYATYGSIKDFLKRYWIGDLIALLDRFISLFPNIKFLIPSSIKGSPCKRLFMYLRWMVRKDNIDIGLWEFIPTEKLIIPLDTHIFQIAKAFNLTSKRTPSLRAAIEITESLRLFCKDDPVKYDWALSHIGIIKNNFLT